MTNVPPLPGQVFAMIHDLDDYTIPRLGLPEEVVLLGSHEGANVTTSKVLGKNTHKVVLDIDLPAQLIESSTPGHFHLYIDHEMTWKQYKKVINAMMEAGLLEAGYKGASFARKWTGLRLPWVRKPNA